MNAARTDAARTDAARMDAAGMDEPLSLFPLPPADACILRSRARMEMHFEEFLIMARIQLDDLHDFIPNLPPGFVFPPKSDFRGMGRLPAKM